MALSELEELAAFVERLDGPDREADGVIAARLRLGNNLPDWASRWAGEWRATIQGSVVLMHDDGRLGPHFVSLPYTASIDAALTLVPEGWRRSFADDPDDLGGVVAELWTAKHNAWACANTPALAICAASLKARAASLPHSEGASPDVDA